MSMAAFAPVLKQLMVDGIMSNPSMPRLPRISVAGLLFLWLSAMLTIMFMGFIFFAEYVYLTATYTSGVAALGVACTALAVALLAAATGLMLMGRQPPRRAMSTGAQPDIAKSITSLIDSLAEELEEPIRDNPKTAIMIASLAGFLAGDARN